MSHVHRADSRGCVYESCRCGAVRHRGPPPAPWHVCASCVVAGYEYDALPQGTWWLSFAESGRFLGVVVTRAPSLVWAIRRAHRLGVNPGGQVLGGQVPDDLVPASVRDRLLCEAEAQEWGASLKLRSDEPL